MDFWRAYRVVQRRKWIILAAVLLTTGIVSLGALTIGMRYDASTGFGPTDQAVRNVVSSGVADAKNILITEDARMEEVRRMASEVTASDNCSRAIYYLAAAGPIRAVVSKALANTRDIESLNSPNDHDKVVEIVGGVIEKTPYEQLDRLVKEIGVPASLWGEFIYLDNKLSAFNVPRDFLRADNAATSVRNLSQNIEISILNSRNMIASVRDRDPRKAEILANALTAAYRQKYDDQSQSAAKSNMKFYVTQLVSASQAFTRSQNALREFRIRHKDVFLPDQIAHAIRTSDAAKTQLDDLQENLQDLDAQIAASRARLAAIPRMLTRTQTTDDPMIQTLRDKINSLSADLAAKQGLYTDKNPEVQRIEQQIATLKSQLARVQNSTITTKTVTENDDWLAKEKELANLVQRRRGIAARQGVLQASMAKQATLINQLPEVQTELDKLTRQYAGASERYNNLSKRMNEAKEELQQTVAKGSMIINYWAGTSNFSASHPEIPARPGATKRTTAMIVAAFLISLLGSIGLIVGMDLLDTTVRTPLDVERLLEAPVSGIVPRLPGANPLLMPQITHRLPSSVHAESYRFLGTDLLLSATDNPFKTIMVATAKPNQGGTATICNLAITLAQAGQRVALVDADMRRPSLHEIFNLPNEVGLSTVLENGRLSADAIFRTDIENLMVMPGGPAPANAWKLLRSPKMRETIEDLARDFDFVLFDTPSAVVFADAATLATMLDGVLLVVRANEAPSGGEMQVKKLLNKTQARIVGVVLNDMPVQQVESARYYSSYYAPGTKTEIAEAASSSRPALPEKTGDDEI